MHEFVAAAASLFIYICFWHPIVVASMQHFAISAMHILLMTKCFQFSVVGAFNSCRASPDPVCHSVSVSKRNGIAFGGINREQPLSPALTECSDTKWEKLEPNYHISKWQFW